jgi:hypothetical protein
MTWPAFCAWFFGPASTYLLARYGLHRASCVNGAARRPRHNYERSGHG